MKHWDLFKNPAVHTTDHASVTVELGPGDFIRVEKNLASLGFFTPSSKRIKTTTAKQVNLTRFLDGRRTEARVMVVPATLYGLPITSDQDKYLALQKIVTEIRRRDGKVTNPVSFSSAQLLDLLKLNKDSGQNYLAISEWLDLMTSTTIISEEAVYLSGKKSFARDRFKVFERAVSFGQEINPGLIADKNYVWFSDWQLENINNGHLIPINFHTYCQLKTHIAKALVPVIQTWFYATRAEGIFVKRYEELCQILGVKQYAQPSKIREKLCPALDELKFHGYLSDWSVERTSNDDGFKVVLQHGERFKRENRRPEIKHLPATRIAAPDPPRKTLEPQADNTYLDNEMVVQLINRGISEKKARALCSAQSGEEKKDMLRQLAWGDYIIANAAPGKYVNPAGFFVHLIKTKTPVPPDFRAGAFGQTSDEPALAPTGASSVSLAPQNGPSNGSTNQHPPECAGCYGTGMEVVRGKGARRCTSQPFSAGH